MKSQGLRGKKRIPVMVDRLQTWCMLTLAIDEVDGDGKKPNKISACKGKSVLGRDSLKRP
jgi:hypothetical protein